MKRCLNDLYSLYIRCIAVVKTLLVQYYGCCSVPAKAVCRIIGPALWKIGSTIFVESTENMFFLVNHLANFQPKPVISAQKPYREHWIAVFF